MINVVKHIILTVVALGAVTIGAYGQSTKDTTQTKRVKILHADEVEFVKTSRGMEQTLRGNVALYQDSTFFYCDSAIVMDNNIWAKGNIQILQGDSTSIFSDSLFYSGDEKQAELHGQVALLNNENELYTEALSYNLRDKKAEYRQKAYLQRGSTRINSIRGQYWLNQHTAVFADSVVVVDTNFVLRADTLEFDTDQQIAFFHGPTSINQDSNRIYCESGFYDFVNEKAEFAKNASFRNGAQKGKARRLLYDDSTKTITLIGDAIITEEDQIVKGDSIVYDQRKGDAEIHGNGFFKDSLRQLTGELILYNEKDKSLKTTGRTMYVDGDIQLEADALDYDDATGHGTATGNVIWQDTTNDVAIFSDELRYNKKTEYVKAIGERPYMVILLDQDSMFVSGDTLLSEKYWKSEVDSGMTVDTFRRIRVYNDVKIYKNDLQGLCDSLVYTDEDSAFVLMDDPIIWSDTSQFTGDTIKVYVKNKTVDKVFQDQNALIVNSIDLVYYNQIQGKEITSTFRDGNPFETLVEGNAQSIYFALDDEDAYIAANKAICSRILVYFRTRKIREIKFLTLPKAEMLPMDTPGLKDIKLEEFIWNYDDRPKTKDDVIAP